LGENSYWPAVRIGQGILILYAHTQRRQAFGISASDFGINVRDGTRRFWTEDPSIGPEDMATEYLDAYKEAGMALTGILLLRLG
jgi:hypothetical protein